MPFKTLPPLYSVWLCMRDRCRNPNNRQWDDYGGRGISICARWDSYAAFESDMWPRPKGRSIDRIDNDGGYSPDNCRWARRKEQQRNQRRAVYVEIEGRRYRAIELAEASGMKTDTIVKRARQGLTYVELMDPRPRRDLTGLALGGNAFGAKMKARKHCPSGHEFTPENSAFSPQGWRRCKKCHAEKEAIRRVKRKRAQGMAIK